MLLIITFFVVFLNLFLGLLAFWKTPKSATSQMFLVLAGILSLWAVTNFFSVNTLEPEKIYFWLKMVMVVTGAMFPAIYLLVRAFPGTKIDLSRRSIFLIVGFIFITQILAATGLVFSGVSVDGPVVTPKPGLALPIFAFNVLVFLGLSIWSLFKKYRTFTGRQRTQLLFLILGIISTFTLGTLTNFLLVNFLQITSFVAIGPLFTLILVGFIFYAIVRHRFLDIQLVVARAVSFILLTVVFGIFYALIFGLISSWLIGVRAEIRTLLTLTGLALIMAFSFQLLRGYIERFSDKIFFRGKYDENKLLYDLAIIMAATLRLEDMAEKILQQLMAQMRISRGAFFIFGKDNSVEVYHRGFDKMPIFSRDHLSTLTNLATGEIVFEDLPEGSAKDVMREGGFALVGQLRTESEFIGLLALGEKLSGDAFSSRDVHALEVVFPEVAIAMQNAKAYEEISRFNLTLQQEVDKATQELRELNEKLKELDKLKSEFVSVASHELRTPMTAIKSYLWMALAGKGGALNEKQRYYLERSYTSTDRLIKLVNDLLNVSRIESGRLAVNMQKVDIKDLVDQVVGEVKPRFDEMGVKLIVGTSFQPNTLVLADLDKIKEVIINLIGNSLKFTKRDGNVNLEMQVVGDKVTVSVTDNGEGIAADDLPKLFQKFGLVKQSYVTNQNAAQGTGLGLYISKSIVELHGGTIWAESEGKGKGATFRFTLPVYSEAGFAKAQENKNPNGLEIIHSAI